MSDGKNSDIGVWFLDLDFHIGSKISVIWGRFQLIFSVEKLNVHHISTSDLFDLLKACHIMSHPRWSFPPSLKLIRLFVVKSQRCCCWYVTWPWPLAFWSWTVVIHGGSCDQPPTKFENPTPIRSLHISCDIRYRPPLTVHLEPLYIFEIPDPNCSIDSLTYMALRSR